MLYAIHAYEGAYGGLHDREDYAIIDSNSQDEVNNIAENMSYGVMESYSDIMDSIYEDASSQYEEGTEDWGNFIEEIMADNLAYEIYQIIDEHGKTLAELNKEFDNDPEGFIQTLLQ